MSARHRTAQAHRGHRGEVVIVVVAVTGIYMVRVGELSPVL